VRVTLTGASGMIGTRLVATLRERGDQVTVLSRDPERARAKLEDSTRPAGSRDGPPAALTLARWEPVDEQAPSAALEGRDAIVHLAGENIAQRWSASAKRAIRQSRTVGTRRLVGGIEACPARERPRVLVSSSAIGYYGAHGDEPIDEEAPAGTGFLAETCALWESEAQAAQPLGLRVVSVRTGVVLDPSGGALGKMLTPFRLGAGGPVAGGEQYISWIHLDDLLGIVLAAIDDERWSGPVNATAPAPQTNRAFSKALGRALKRPAVLPVPAFALRAMYGEMAEIVTSGARVLPAQALMRGYKFRHPDLDGALRAALGGPSR
jgi:uncharacterized protein